MHSDIPPPLTGPQVLLLAEDAEQVVRRMAAALAEEVANR